MCCKFTMPLGEQKIFQNVLEEVSKRTLPVRTGLINPGDTVAVLANNRRLTPSVFAMNWGYHLPDGKLVFNARSETASRKPMFADGMAQRRCLIPASCYYEWERSTRQKYRIYPEGENGFFLAGIYRLEGKTPVFSVLTKEPNPEIAFIHDRMPAILPLSMEREWLDPSQSAIEMLHRIRVPIEYTAC